MSFPWSKKFALSRNLLQQVIAKKKLTTVLVLYRHHKYVNLGKVLQCECIMLNRRLGLHKITYLESVNK
jgi:hypothetical protein